jgi:hypothetical protein
MEPDDTRQLLRRAQDLRAAPSMGLRTGLDEIAADEFFDMQAVDQGRDACAARAPDPDPLCPPMARILIRNANSGIQPM